MFSSITLVTNEEGLKGPGCANCRKPVTLRYFGNRTMRVRSKGPVGVEMGSGSKVKRGNCA
jgi:hypothetical protein